MRKLTTEETKAVQLLADSGARCRKLTGWQISTFELTASNSALAIKIQPSSIMDGTPERKLEVVAPDRGVMATGLTSLDAALLAVDFICQFPDTVDSLREELKDVHRRALAVINENIECRKEILAQQKKYNQLLEKFPKSGDKEPKPILPGDTVFIKVSENGETVFTSGVAKFSISVETPRSTCSFPTSLLLTAVPKK